MKNYPETELKLRQRICANPECGIMFCPKNNKAIYHCPECKNRANYLRQQEEFAEEFMWFKDFLHNRRVLATIYEGGIRIVTDETLMAFKFKWQVGQMPEWIKDKGIVIPYGKYLICALNATQYQIIKL